MLFVFSFCLLYKKMYINVRIGEKYFAFNPNFSEELKYQSNENWIYVMEVN